jgi:hypothetical protein
MSNFKKIRRGGGALGATFRSGGTIVFRDRGVLPLSYPGPVAMYDFLTKKYFSPNLTLSTSIIFT